MKTMWAPWRIEYILNNKENRCIFCAALQDQDDLTLFKGKVTLVTMNKYPYINGHLLVAPIRHISSLDQLNRTEMGEMLATVEKAVGILKTVSGKSSRGRRRRASSFSYCAALVG